MTAAVLDIDPDLDRVAETALNTVFRLCENPAELFEHLVNLCRTQPGHAAQLTMTLASWIDFGTAKAELEMRAVQKAAILAWNQRDRRRPPC